MLDWSKSEADAVISQRDVVGLHLPLVLASEVVLDPQRISDRCTVSAERLLSAVVWEILDQLGLDLVSPFQLGMDHKLVQALHFHHYLGQPVPLTVGLGRLFLEAENCDISTYAQQRFDKGFVLKSTRGYASSPEAVRASSRTLSTHSLAAQYESGFDGSPTSEVLLVQELIDVDQEYRVHSLCGRIIPSLSFRQHGKSSSLGEDDLIELSVFIENVSRKLPYALRNNLSGWDIARATSGELKIIEVNYSGMHPVYDPGFHCSGHFQNLLWGQVNVAHLLLFLKVHEGVSIEYRYSEARSDVGSRIMQLLYRIEEWFELIQISYKIHDLWADTSLVKPFCSKSLRERIFSNESSPMERRFQETVDWLRRMTVDIHSNT